MLVNGKWSADWQPVQATDAKGGFVRQTSSFRHWVTPDGRPGPTGEGGFAAEAGRYHLYVALTCPWASLMARKLKGLESAISISVVGPVISAEGWRFGDYPGADRDTLNGATYIRHSLFSSSLWLPGHKRDRKSEGGVTMPLEGFKDQFVTPPSVWGHPSAPIHTSPQYADVQRGGAADLPAAPR
jgi:glutathionyl-hydroquinone reductase